MAGRFVVAGGFLVAFLQAVRRDFAVFSSASAVVRSGRVEDAISEILVAVRNLDGWWWGRTSYLRRPAPWRVLTRPIAAIMGILLRPVVRRRRRS